MPSMVAYIMVTVGVAMMTYGSWVFLGRRRRREAVPHEIAVIIMMVKGFLLLVVGAFNLIHHSDNPELGKMQECYYRISPGISESMEDMSVEDAATFTPRLTEMSKALADGGRDEDADAFCRDLSLMSIDAELKAGAATSFIDSVEDFKDYVASEEERLASSQ